MRARFLFLIVQKDCELFTNFARLLLKNTTDFLWEYRLNQAQKLLTKSTKSCIIYKIVVMRFGIALHDPN